MQRGRPDYKGRRALKSYFTRSCHHLLPVQPFLYPFANVHRNLHEAFPEYREGLVRWRDDVHEEPSAFLLRDKVAELCLYLPPCRRKPHAALSVRTVRCCFPLPVADRQLPFCFPFSTCWSPGFRNFPPRLRHRLWRSLWCRAVSWHCR